MKIVRFNPHLALNFEVPRYSEYAGRAYNTFLERGAAKNNLRDSVHVSYEQKVGIIIVLLTIYCHNKYRSYSRKNNCT